MQSRNGIEPFGSLPRMLFVRTYNGLLGGHLKVFDYLKHVAASGLFEPVLFLTPDSTASPQEFLPEGVRTVRSPVEADAYFVAGFNWRILDEAGVNLAERPVVNLIQGLRHASPGDPRGAYLPRPALRICVSPSVFAAVEATGLTNGPLVSIPNGIDLQFLTAFKTAKRDCVFIAGAKNPQLAHELAQLLARDSIASDVSDELIERKAFLARMASCAIAVALPAPDEGFFLPALEAMALECAVVLPQCEGAASYAIDGKTCLSPQYSAQALAACVRLLRANSALAAGLRHAAKLIAAEHSLQREREQFISALRAYVR